MIVCQGRQTPKRQEKNKKEQGWLGMEKIDTDYKINDKSEKCRLNLSRCIDREVASLKVR